VAAVEAAATAAAATPASRIWHGLALVVLVVVVVMVVRAAVRVGAGAVVPGAALASDTVSAATAATTITVIAAVIVVVVVGAAEAPLKALEELAVTVGVTCEDAAKNAVEAAVAAVATSKTLRRLREGQGSLLRRPAPSAAAAVSVQGIEGVVIVVLARPRVAVAAAAAVATAAAPAPRAAAPATAVRPASVVAFVVVFVVERGVCQLAELGPEVLRRLERVVHVAVVQRRRTVVGVSLLLGRLAAREARIPPVVGAGPGQRQNVRVHPGRELPPLAACVPRALRPRAQEVPPSAAFAPSSSSSSSCPQKIINNINPTQPTPKNRHNENHSRWR